MSLARPQVLWGPSSLTSRDAIPVHAPTLDPRNAPSALKTSARDRTDAAFGWYCRCMFLRIQESRALTNTAQKIYAATRFCEMIYHLGAALGVFSLARAGTVSACAREKSQPTPVKHFTNDYVPSLLWWQLVLLFGAPAFNQARARPPPCLTSTPNPAGTVPVLVAH